MQTAKEILLHGNSKPYWKILKGLCMLSENGLISQEELDAFEEELNLLEKGINRSHNSRPRIYWEGLGGK